MSSVFISYSVKDEPLARSLHSIISLAGVETFLAGISIEPGSDWTREIFKNLEGAKWVFFLASKNSIKSAAVQQEIGASLAQRKTIIPILIDITPKELPAWAIKHQSLDINSSPEILHSLIERIAEKIQADKFWSGVIVGAIIIGLCISLNKA